jgi:diphthine-ammonia ligase
MSQGLKVAVSWSGGKDSCFSLYRAISNGLQPCFLLNMVNRDAKRSMSHGLDPKLIAAQADVLEIPLLQREATWDTYEREFKEAVAELKQKGVDGVVFGDIDIEEHKNWVERVCGDLEVIAILPLWGDEPYTLLTEFLQAGFEAIVVSAKAEFFSDEWLGKPLTTEIVEELSGLETQSGIHPCGEQGEYHTFVIDGPIFKKRLKIIDSHTVSREGYRFLDISRYELEGK